MAANLTTLLRTLITANHILHYNSVVDAYGHISVRTPLSNDTTSADLPATFYMSANRAPALVSTPTDLVEYFISNASSVSPTAPRGYIERYIHSEMYKCFPEVQCVIHAHAPDILPYATSGVPLKPVFHLPSFLGLDVPVWDIEAAYNDTDVHDLLVRNEHEGASLADIFVAPENGTVVSPTTVPDRKLVLMRKHGFSTWGDSIEKAVFRAVFAVTNARVETDAMLLRNAFVAGGLGGDGVWGSLANAFEPLTGEQAGAAEAANDGTIDRPWGLWSAEVESNALYVNDG